MIEEKNTAKAYLNRNYGVYSRESSDNNTNTDNTYRDVVEDPGHYHLEGLPGVEAKHIVKAVIGEASYKDHCVASALEYMIRYKKKGGDIDLMKAQEFLKMYFE